MRSNQIYSLLLPLGVREKKEVGRLLLGLLPSATSPPYRLFKKMTEVKKWSDQAEAKCAGEFKKPQDYYKARRALGLLMLRIIGNLHTSQKLSFNYEFVIKESLFCYVLDDFVQDVEALIEQEKYPHAAVLRELGELGKQTLTKAKDLAKLDDLPDLHTVRGWGMEIWRLQDGIGTIRQSIKLPMTRRIAVARKLEREFTDYKPQTARGQRIYLGLMARVYWLGGDRQQAVQYGMESLEAAFEYAEQAPDALLDEFAYVVPLLSDEGMREESTKFSLKIGMVEFLIPHHEVRRERLEIENLITIAASFKVFAFAEKAESLLKSAAFIKDGNQGIHQFYALALTYFMFGSHEKVGRILNKHISFQGKPKTEISWFVECLKMFNLFQNGEEELALQFVKVLKNCIPPNESDYYSLVCDVMDSLVRTPISNRKVLVQEWLFKLNNLGEKPANIRFRSFFDIQLYLISFLKQSTMADIADLSIGNNFFDEKLERQG